MKSGMDQWIMGMAGLIIALLFNSMFNPRWLDLAMVALVVMVGGVVIGFARARG